jgi:5-methylthioribose kinase
MQNFCSALVDPQGAMVGHEEKISNIIDQFAVHENDFTARVVRLRNLVKDACRDMCPYAGVDIYGTQDNDDRDLGNIFKEAVGTMRFLHPDVIRNTRPVGVATNAQLSQIMERSRAIGYDRETLERVVINRVGKSRLHDLSKAEVGQLLNYLRSPGAEW